MHGQSVCNNASKLIDFEHTDKITEQLLYISTTATTSCQVG